MPLIGVCVIPTTSSNVSLAASLISGLSYRFPEKEHEPFHLDFRLFVDTSTQLPGSDTTQRKYTHLLSTSHEPQTTYVGTTKAGKADDPAFVTIPSSSTDTFTGLLVTKFQPLWYLRQNLSVEDGVSVSISNGAWSIKVGDLKVAARSQGAGTLRGTVIELTREIEIGSSLDSPLTQEQTVICQELLKSGLEDIFEDDQTKGTLDSAKFVVSFIKPWSLADGEGSIKHTPNWDLARLYMNALRGQR